MDKTKEISELFKIEELEERLETAPWSGGGSGCTYTSSTTGIEYPDSDCDGTPDFAE